MIEAAQLTFNSNSKNSSRTKRHRRESESDCINPSPLTLWRIRKPAKIVLTWIDGIDRNPVLANMTHAVQTMALVIPARLEDRTISALSHMDISTHPKHLLILTRNPNSMILSERLTMICGDWGTDHVLSILKRFKFSLCLYHFLVPNAFHSPSVQHSVCSRPLPCTVRGSWEDVHGITGEARKGGGYTAGLIPELAGWIVERGEGGFLEAYLSVYIKA